MPSEIGLARPIRPGSLMRRIKVSASARTHILAGDSKGGGHRFGANRGKSEFPVPWSDNDVIVAIEDIANDPASTRMKGRGGRVILIGIRKSVSVTVVVDLADRFIITGFPT
jgi:Bacterial EndoU nuclease